MERFLRSLDLDEPDIQFELLGGTTATNWALRREGKRIAGLKCTSGNTNHHGAIIAYQLGRELGFSIYPVAVYRDVDRDINGQHITEQCALKEWNTVFTQYYWTLETFTETKSRNKQKLAAALRCDSPLPEPSDAFTYSARSAYGDPALPGKKQTTYRGTTSLNAAARDFSNMMVVDTLIGNEDRFPGGNLFFGSQSRTYQVTDGAVVFEAVRLFSLDNEAAFMGAKPGSTHAARDLGDHVSRFDTAMMERLKALAGDPPKLLSIASGDQRRARFMQQAAAVVISRFEEAQATCDPGAASFLTPPKNESPDSGAES